MTPSSGTCRRPGFDVVAVAADGHQALARFPAARPQVVVLDLQIPGPNGVEVTAQVLAHDPSARVLILSARASRPTCWPR